MLMDRIRATVIGLTLVGLAGLGVAWSVFRGEAAEPPPAVASPPSTVQFNPPPSTAETANFRVSAANERIADLVAKEAASREGGGQMRHKTEIGKVAARIGDEGVILHASFEHLDALERGFQCTHGDSSTLRFSGGIKSCL